MGREENLLFLCIFLVLFSSSRNDFCNTKVFRAPGIHCPPDPWSFVMLTGLPWAGREEWGWDGKGRRLWAIALLLGPANLLFRIPLAGHANRHVQLLICHLLLSHLLRGISHPTTDMSFSGVQTPPPPGLLLSGQSQARQATSCPAAPGTKAGSGTTLDWGRQVGSAS